MTFYVAVRRPGGQWRCVARLDDVERALALQVTHRPDLEISISAEGAMTKRQIGEYNRHLAGMPPAVRSERRPLSQVSPEKWLELLLDTLIRTKGDAMENSAERYFHGELSEHGVD